MAEAQFTPYLQPGGIVDAGFSGASQMQSLMERGQLMRQRSEMAVRQQAEFDVLRPVMEAKAQADTVIAQNALKGAEMMQQYRAQYGQASKDAGAEYQAAMKLPTYEQQANALSDIAQKYSWFELVPEGKAFVHAITNQALQQTRYGILDSQNRGALDVVNSRGQQALDREQLRNTGRLDEIGARGDEARKTNAAKETPEMKDAQAAADAEAAGDHVTANFLRTVKRAGKGEGTAIGLANEITKRQLDPKADPKITALLIENLEKMAHFKGDAKREFLQNIEAMKKAQAEGDVTTYRQLDARNRYLATRADMENTYDEKPVEEPSTGIVDRLKNAAAALAGKTPHAPIPATKVPAIPKNAPTVTIDGRTYPLAHDKNGNPAAYDASKNVYIPIH